MKKLKTLLAGDDGDDRCGECVKKDAQIEALLQALARQQAVPVVITQPTVTPVVSPAWPSYPIITCESPAQGSATTVAPSGMTSSVTYTSPSPGMRR